MDNNTNQEDPKQEILTAVNEQDVALNEKPKRNWLKSSKVIAVMVLLVGIIALVIWMIEVFNVYNKSKVYKEAYDIVQEEIIYCDKIQNTSQKQEVFNYCNQFRERFKVVDREVEK
jgi:hypothetical protein